MTLSIHSRLKQLPWLQECVWSTKHIAGSAVKPFNGRWDRLRKLFAQIDQSSAPPALSPRRLVVFASNDYWIDYLLPVAAVLAGRNCSIDFVWLPYLDLPASEQVERYRRWSTRFSVPQHPRFRVINLLDYASADIQPAMTAVAESSAARDTCYFNCKEVCDPLHIPEDQRLFSFRRKRNAEVLGRLRTFFQGRQYDSALTANALLGEFGAFYWHCTQIGLPCVSLDSFEADDQIVAANRWPCCDWRTDEIWEADAPHELTPEREERVLRRIAFRDTPELQTDRWHRLQATASAPLNELRRTLDLRQTDPIALMCTNVAWDSAVIGKVRAFKTMKDWYLKVIRWFAAKPDWQLLVRTHPVEAKLNQPKSVSQFIEQEFPTLPANVRLIRPTDKINTYGLMKMTDLGLVYTSTVGLEMAIRGLPVIVAGKVHYANKGFTWNPADEESYFKLLDGATEGRRLQVTADHVKLARCYFDVYFENFPKPMPWRWSKLQGDLATTSVSTIASGRCSERIVRTFDYLAGRDVEG
jgi:hypothetical protein